MKKLLLLTIPFVLAGAVSADGGLAYVKMLGSSAPSYVTTLRIGTLTRVFGTKINVPVVAFAGTASKNRTSLGTAGIGVVPEFRIASELTFSIGIVAGLTNNRPTSIGGIAGLTWRLPNK